MRTLSVIATLLVAHPAVAVPLPEAPSPEPPMDVPVAAATDERDVARGLNKAGRILPIALGLPLSVASVSITDTAPLAWAAGDAYGYSVLRGVGVPMMGGAYAANILINATARASRRLAGGRWQDDLGWFIAGTALMGGGLGMTIASGQGVLLDIPAASASLAIGGGVAWGAGSILLIVDSMKTAFAVEKKLALAPRPPGLWMSPVVAWQDGPRLGVVGAF